MSCAQLSMRRSTGLGCRTIKQAPAYRRQRQTASPCASLAEHTVITSTLDLPDEVDVVVIGSGIGGLSCAAMLGRYNYKVLVVESHTAPGGAAHHWSRGPFSFDSGAALFSGINPTVQRSLTEAPSFQTTNNPLSSVLAAIDETVPGVIDLDDSATCLVYPDGKQYRTQLASAKFVDVVAERLGPDAAREWTAFQRAVAELCVSAGAVPPAAVRLDPGVAWTAAFRRPAAFLRYALNASSSVGKTFSAIVDGAVTRPEVRALITMITEGTCSAPPEEVDAAYMLRAFHEMWAPGTQLQYPEDGSQAIVDTLLRGLYKFDGQLALGFHVTSILSESFGDSPLPSGISSSSAARARTEQSVTAMSAAPPVSATATTKRRVGTLGTSVSSGADAGATPRNVATGAALPNSRPSGAGAPFGWLEPGGQGDEEGVRAGGVQLRAPDGSVRNVRARHAVISNASIWDTVELLDAGGLRGGVEGGLAAELADEATLRGMFHGEGGTWGNGAVDALGAAGRRRADAEFEEYARNLQMNESMMHLHVGFEAQEGEDLPFHTYFLESEHTGTNGWPTIVIPSTAACGLAPAGHHVLHATMSEPYSPWEGLDRASAAYKHRKQERAEVLWGFVRQIIPDIDERVKVANIGTPSTHERFLRRKRGTYGPANLLTMSGALPKAVKPLANVFCCGDSVFPGAGTPAVAANGMWVANTLVPVSAHSQMLQDIGV